MHVFYLHGFASSPGTKKGQWFKAKFAETGVNLHLPDLNAPDFEHLTLTAMLDVIRAHIEALPPDDVAVIGSSLGGAAALHYADRLGDAVNGRRVTKLVLLAPALDFKTNRERTLGADGMDSWRESGWLNVHNYAVGGAARVHYGLYTDMLQYDSFGVRLELPTLIFHGTHDASVPVEQSVVFAELRPNVDLRVVESDHELLDQLDVMWAAVQSFLYKPGSV